MNLEKPGESSWPVVEGRLRSSGESSQRLDGFWFRGPPGTHAVLVKASLRATPSGYLITVYGGLFFTVFQLRCFFMVEISLGYA